MTKELITKIGYKMRIFRLWILWANTPEKLRKDLDLVLSGIQPHQCDYKESFFVDGFEYKKCTHKGCNKVMPIN